MKDCENCVLAERTRIALENRVTTSMFKWIASGLGGLLVLILSFVVSLAYSMGELRTELKVQAAENKTTIAMLSKQFDHISKTQRILNEAMLKEKVNNEVQKRL